MIASMHVEPSLISRIKEAQDNDDWELWSIVENIKTRKQTEFHIDDHGIVWMGNRLCVPDNKELKEEVMEEENILPLKKGIVSLAREHITTEEG